MWVRALAGRMPARRVPVFFSDHARYPANKSDGDAPHALYSQVREELETIPGFVVSPAEPCTLDALRSMPKKARLLSCGSDIALLGGPDGAIPDATIGPLATRGGEAELRHHLCTVGGALQAVRALKSGEQIAGNLVGGSPRPFPDNLSIDASLFDDVAIACASALHEGLYKRILVCDLSADYPSVTCTAAREISKSGDGSIYTFSIHSDGAGAGQSPCDFFVECKAGTPDHLYMSAVTTALQDVIETVRPELIVYRPGVESLCSISSPLGLSRVTMQERNMLVYRLALERNIPVLVSAGSGALDGGFPLVAEGQLKLLADARLDVFKGALQAVVINSHRQLYF